MASTATDIGKQVVSGLIVAAVAGLIAVFGFIVPQSSDSGKDEAARPTPAPAETSSPTPTGTSSPASRGGGAPADEPTTGDGPSPAASKDRPSATPATTTATPAPARITSLRIDAPDEFAAGGSADFTAAVATQRGAVGPGDETCWIDWEYDAGGEAVVTGRGPCGDPFTVDDLLPGTGEVSATATLDSGEHLTKSYRFTVG